MRFEDASFWFPHRNKIILAAIKRYPPADGPIFDLGAGNGYVALALEQAGWPTIAIEPSAAGAANAASRGVAHVVCGGLPSVAFAARTAGAIGLFDVLEHIETDRAFLVSLRPYLKDRGRLYLTVPAYQWLWSSSDVHGGHFRRYTRSALRHTLEAAGFHVEFTSYFFSWLPLPVLVFRSWRSGHSATRASRQHGAGGSALRHIAERSLAFEIDRVARGAPMAFGGSCLAVATCDA